MPEPPSVFDVTKVGPPTGAVSATAGGPTPIQGQPGAVPANAVVRVTDLDGADTAYSTTASASGDFKIALPVQFGDELRFEWLVGAQRSLPVDVLFLQAGKSFQLEPSPRFDCVTVTPGLVLDFGAAPSETLALGIENHCATALSVGSHEQRRNLANFSFNTVTPVTIEPNASAQLRIAYTQIGSAPVEDTLFILLTEAGTTIRYPITLAAAP